MRSQENHAHAVSRYREIETIDYLNLFRNAWEVKVHPFLSLNVHLPFEVQHPLVYTHLERGIQFVRFGEGLKKLFDIALYWENSPEQNYGSWDLKFGQTDWTHIPRNIELCLDTGHLMLGSQSIQAARERIEGVFTDRNKQIRHLHIHENDLLHDDHAPIGRVITEDIFRKLISNGRTFIFEKDEILTSKK